ncbi:MAG: DUF2238 domain-containing protein [Candidatus Omnitrophica bacterium]|nr:DUF2238 domain-containing protein [Candidatus Omnitrophota bacterium]
MPKKIIPIVLFNIIYISVSSFFIFQKSNIEFLIYTGIVIVAAGIIIWLYNRYGLSIPLLWCFSLWGLAHLSGGLYEVPAGWPTAGETRVLYNWWIIDHYFKFDQLVHGFGFGMCAWITWQVLRTSQAERFGIQSDTIRPTGGIMFLCVLSAMGLGCINEILEFVVMLTVPETNVGGYYNTGWDLVSNMVGAGIIASAIYIHGRITQAKEVA